MIVVDSSMEGGHLLGQGSYGCAFTPPLLCKSYKLQKQGKVGKVTGTEDANREIQIANILRRYPLVNNYILLPDPESCEPAPIKDQKDREIKDCESIMRTNEYKVKWNQTKQLFIPYGGKNPLGNLLLASNIHPKYFSFFDFLRHVLEAGSLLLNAGVCHFDLHPNNFIQDRYGVVRLLDLGQAFDVRHITQETVDSRWKVLVFGNESDAPNSMVTNAEAPEITVINAMRNGYSLEEAIEKVVRGKAIFGEIEKYMGISKETQKRELKEFFISSESVLQKDWVQFWKLYWPGFDSWSIGALALNILKYQMTWLEFIQGEWQQKQSMVNLTIKGLLHPNPRKRLDCMEALFLFDPNNNWIRRFGKPWLEKRQEIRARLTKN
jgi:serine/threonine protein kinase